MKYHFSPGNLLSDRIQAVFDRMIPRQLDILEDRASGAEPSHTVENFRVAAGLSEGNHRGMVFQDSDLGKWIEAASCKLMAVSDPALEQEIDRLIGIISKAQRKDGYINTYYTLQEPDGRWKNLAEGHELYCFGHLAEAAVAYFRATGKKSLLKIMCRMADYLCDVFGPEANQIHGYPGHPEAELALFRLYQATGSRRYLDLCGYFINERGRQPCIFIRQREEKNRSMVSAEPDLPDLRYFQAHLPVRDQTEATGRAVRALYLYTGMALYARETGDVSLLKACRQLWDNIVRKKMYITGGLGASAKGESFMGDYELPNDTAYAETCASVAMCFFARAMSRIHRNGAYNDIIEKELYNTILASVSLDSDRFFYVNPLEVIPGVSGVQQGYEHVMPQRRSWFPCACCPPNVARFIADLPEYCYEEKGSEIIVHQYIGGTVLLNKAEISLETRFPYDGSLRYTVTAVSDVTFTVRIPAYASIRKCTLRSKNLTETQHPQVRDGFTSFSLHTGINELEIQLGYLVQTWYANKHVRADAGSVCLSYGPLVYCFEGCDNPEPLSSVRIDTGSLIIAEPYSDELNGIRRLRLSGYVRVDDSDNLYSARKPQYRKIKLSAIPYYAWGNRGLHEMRVWMRFS